jgi:orotidine-5'-phosphate decarboxylase
MTDSPIIIALDVENATIARTLVSSIGDAAAFYKVGLELFTSAGPDFVRELKAQGHQVFLDLKLHDIGETVRRAVAQVVKIAPDFLTIHATGQVMRSAVEGRGADPGAAPLKLLAVGVLTSLDDADLEGDGYEIGVSELVEKRARSAMAAGVDGIVCSAREVARVREITGRKMILLNPGVRSAGASTGDQKRIATPAEAIASGADYIVVGRQVTRSTDPRGETLKILDEISVTSHSASPRRSD